MRRNGGRGLAASSPPLLVLLLLLFATLSPPTAHSLSVTASAASAAASAATGHGRLFAAAGRAAATSQRGKKSCPYPGCGAGGGASERVKGPGYQAYEQLSMDTIDQANGGGSGSQYDNLDGERDKFVKIARDSATQMKMDMVTMSHGTAFRKAGSGLGEPPVSDDAGFR